MQISEKYFLEFKELMKKKVGEEQFAQMTEQELMDSAIKLVNLVRVVYQPIKK